MKRRGFLGFLGGAAAAGPAVAKEALARLPVGMGDVVGGGFSTVADGYGGGTGYLSAAEPTGGDDWRLKEIASLRRILSGDLTAEERGERDRQALEKRQHLISQNVASLVSVSSTRKLGIYNARAAAHHEDIARIRTQSYLQHLLMEVCK